jgi:hypothetical protein
MAFSVGRVQGWSSLLVDQVHHLRMWMEEDDGNRNRKGNQEEKKRDTGVEGQGKAGVYDHVCVFYLFERSHPSSSCPATASHRRRPSCRPSPPPASPSSAANRANRVRILGRRPGVLFDALIQGESPTACLSSPTPQ